MKRAFFMTAVIGSCETFQPPPEGFVEGGTVLADPAAPLVVRFTKAFRPETLKVEVVPYDVDNEGNLADEVGDGSGDLHAYFTHDPTQADPTQVDFGGTADIGADRLTIFPIALPVGRKLAVLVEPGITSSATGVASKVRGRILFSYEFKCSHKGTKLLTTGPYVFLIDVESPLGTQIQLFGQIRVDQATGDFVGQFTNADRNRDGSRCPGGCKPEDACQTVPAPACVAPSVKAGSVDEWPDYIPNVTPPTGYTFLAHGCAEDVGDAVAMGIEPVDLVVQQPAVTAQGLVVLCSFQRDAQGVLRATGTGTAAQIVLGTKGFGAAKGTVHARSLPPDQLPAGIPFPP
jgi:hypothetical protein